MTIKKTKKRNPTDNTTRNAQASKKRDDALSKRILALKKRMKVLELLVTSLLAINNKR